MVEKWQAVTIRKILYEIKTEMEKPLNGLRVQSKQCSTCIYRKDSPLNLKALEAEISDGYGGFKNHRKCHHSNDVCCRGFWNRHKDQFAAGQNSTTVEYGRICRRGYIKMKISLQRCGKYWYCGSRNLKGHESGICPKRLKSPSATTNICPPSSTNTTK